MMGSWPGSIRGRLTLWYAAALAVMVLLTSITVYTLIRQRIIQQLQTELEIDTDVIAVIMSGPEEGELEEGELAEVWLAEEFEELADQEVLALIRITCDDSLFFVSEGWWEAGLDRSIKNVLPGASWRWTSEDGTPHMLLMTEFQEETGHFLASVAVEAETLAVLSTLVILFLLVFPFALALAAFGGYMIAGRVLAPIRAMTETAEKITSRKLSERLPVENPRDELGRLSTVFNETLSRLERSFEQLRRFTAEASHALRTPLTALRSVGEVGLQEGDGPEFYRDLVGSMLEETDRLRGLVESLLTITRAEGGQLQTNPEPVHLGELANETVDRLRILAEEKNQKMRVEVVSDREITTDREMVRQALLNLVDNAIRYTQVDGEITVSLRDHPYGFACLEVHDNGPGISSDNLPHIFERFYRIIENHEERGQGSGLGLAIAELAIQMNGGRIEVESEVGTGTTFRIMLPTKG